MKKVFLILLFLIAFSFATTPPVPTSTTGVDTEGVLRAQIGIVLGILAVLMMLFGILAAVVYVIGQMFGAETKAKATVWARSMLTAVGVAAALLAVLFLMLPGLLGVGDPTPAGGEDFISETLGDLKKISESALVVLMITLVILSALVYALGQMAGTETRARASVWATGILAGALVSAVIYVVFFQLLATFESTLFAGLGYGIASYGNAIIAVAFFVTAIILITYLVSKVFQVPEWEAYLSIELSNLTGSFLVLLFIIGLFGVGDLFSLMVTGVYKTPPQAAIVFMTQTIADSTLEGMYDIFRIQTCTSLLNIFSRRIGEAVLTNVFKVFPGIDVFVSITNVIGYGLVSIYGSVQAQIALLKLIDAFMLNFFLPAGLILRFFPPTRDAGSFLIALAFAFQFVFPLVYLINAEVVDYLGIETYDKKQSELLIQSLCGPFKYGVLGVLFNPAAGVPIVSSFPGVQSLFKALLSETALHLVSMAEFVPIMKSLSVLSLFALFIPAFALVITLAFINAMTKFLTQKL
jgi:hypothetical protein